MAPVRRVEPNADRRGSAECDGDLVDPAAFGSMTSPEGRSGHSPTVAVGRNVREDCSYALQ
jgi:hypothetical protein